MDHSKIQETRLIHGRVLYVDGDTVWLARGRHLLQSGDGGETWEERAVLPIGRLRELLTLHRLGRRLGRVGFHHYAALSRDSAVVVAHDAFFELVPGERCLRKISPLIGSRPLAICCSGEKIYYGEYRRNPEHTPVYVWSVDLKRKRSKAEWRFSHVRHVHGVFTDPYSESIWITTGDANDESAIWKTDDQFVTMNRVVGGMQKYRAVHLVFTESYIYFGSDAPSEENCIYRLDRRSLKVVPLRAVSGPVFFGCKIGSCIFFSTAVEFGEATNSNDAEIWGTRDGREWIKVASHRRGLMHYLKYFQHAQIMFPAGPGDRRNLWYSPIATKNDQLTFRVPLETIRGF